MPTDRDIRDRQSMRNRTTVILLVLFVAIVFALSFSHILKEQPPEKKTTFVREPHMTASLPS